MSRRAPLTMALALAMAMPMSAVMAQGATQTIAAVDVHQLSTGLRGSKIIGSDVVNEKQEGIGKVDDLIISRDDHEVFAILSVGGFLGLGSKLVAVRYQDLQLAPDNKGFVLPGATKESLKALPEYAYAH